jgi:hypothetical protein
MTDRKRESETEINNKSFGDTKRGGGGERKKR